MQDVQHRSPKTLLRMGIRAGDPPPRRAASSAWSGSPLQARVRGRAFTLIELLVVIAIMGMLATLSIPSVMAALVSGKQAASASNMRQIGLAMYTYAADNDFKLPETSHTASVGNAWIYVLAPYLENVDKVRICPADPKGSQRLAAGGTSYVLNSYLFVPELDPFGEVIGGPSNDLKRINSLSKTMLGFVCSDLTGIGPANDHTHSSSWTTWSAVTQDIAPDRFTTIKRPDHSAGSSNYLYADGHVEKHTAASMKARIDSGDNFAVPQ